MVTADPKVASWICQLQAVLYAAPPGVWLFAGAGSLYAMRPGDDGRPVMTPAGGFDQGSILYHFSSGPLIVDGGDW